MTPSPETKTMTEKLKATYEARYCPGMPTDCCDYGVISHETGKEVCRVWDRDDAERITGLLNTRHPTPAADEVEAVARAIYLAMHGDKGGRWECVEPRYQDQVWGAYARAAIAALQARSTEPAGMMDAAWDAYQNTGIDLCADSDDETRKCVENAVRAALRHAEPAGEEPVAFVCEADLRALATKPDGDDMSISPVPRPEIGMNMPLYARPAPSNPERLVEALRRIDRMTDGIDAVERSTLYRTVKTIVRNALSAAPRNNIETLAGNWLHRSGYEGNPEYEGIIAEFVADLREKGL